MDMAAPAAHKGTYDERGNYSFMSRAFVRETDAVDDLPDRVVSDYPNYVTPEGLALIEQTISGLLNSLATAQQKGDRDTMARVSRDLRYWQARRETAITVAGPQETHVVRFGSTVTIERDDGRRQSYRIVGEDEADPAKGLLSHASPLARALIGKSAGDVVPAGSGKAEIAGVG